MGINRTATLASVPPTGAPQTNLEVCADTQPATKLALGPDQRVEDQRPDQREVLRCLHCQLVQFRTQSNHCRRCGFDLDAVPAPAAAAPVPALPLLTSPLEPGVETAEASGIAVPDVAGAIRGWRQRRGLSQRELAERMRVPRTYVSKIENDKAMPTIASLQRMASAMDTSIATLLATDCGHASSYTDEQPLFENAFVQALLPFLPSLSRQHRGQLLDASRSLAGA